MLRTLSLAVLCVVAAACPRKTEAVDAGPIVRTDGGVVVAVVDVGAPAGRLPTYYEPSAFVDFAPPEMIREFQTDSRETHGMLGVSNFYALSDSTSLADYEARLAASPATALALEAADAGVQLLLQIEGTPTWLSAKPTERGLVCSDNQWHTFQTVAPPAAKWPEWEQMVAATVRHFNVDLGLTNVWYQLWEEPDGPCFWTDSQAAYLELWRHTVAGAKAADPNARVGGPGVANGVRASIKGDPTSATQALIDDSARQGLDLGFVAYHLFGLTPEEGKTQGLVALGWLRDAGYPATTPIVISSHNPLEAHLSDPSWPTPPTGLSDWQPDTEMGAAQVLSLMKWLDASGAAGYQVMYQLDDHDLDRSPFPHDWGMRGPSERGGLRKAIYHAHTMVGRLDRNLVTVSLPEDPELQFPQLHVVASSSGNRLTILAWRYVSLPMGAPKVIMSNLGPADLARLGGEAALRAFLSGNTPASSVTADTTEQAGLERARREYRRRGVLVGQDLALSLELKGFTSSGGYELQRSLVDATTSNAYYHFVNGGLAAAQAHQGLEQVDVRHLGSLAELGPIPLGPYAATLIELTRPGP